MALELSMDSLLAGMTQYTCPMHPEVRQDEPGYCPICGMALEPMTVSLREEENPELIDMTKRFWFGVSLTVPILVLAMGETIPGNPMAQWFSPRTSIWVQFFLATPVVFWCGWPLLQRGWISIVNRSLNMFTHIGIGGGTDIAMESAGVTLVKGDLRGIVRARLLSRATMRNIRQNLFFAFFYNFLGVPIAAGVLYPFFGVLLSPIIASVAMTFSSVSVISNALGLNRVELP